MEGGGGTTLKFTDDGKLDLVNSHPPRGTYYVQLEATDSYDTAASQAAAVIIPNNAPVVSAADDIAVEGASYRGDKFVFSAFTKTVAVDTVFTDYDTDNLAYSWAVRDKDADKVSFVTTTSGASVLKSRVAGHVVVLVSADDGYGGKTTQEVTIEIPVPTVAEDDLNLDVLSLLEDTDGTIDVIGTLTSPVWPVVTVNGEEAGSVALAEALAGVSTIKSADADTSESLDVSTSPNDTYYFTALGVPASSGASQVDIDVYTEVDGGHVLLANKALAIDDIGGGSGEVPAGVDGSGLLYGGSCSLLVRPDPCGIAPQKS